MKAMKVLRYFAATLLPVLVAWLVISAARWGFSLYRPIEGYPAMLVVLNLLLLWGWYYGLHGKGNLQYLLTLPFGEHTAQTRRVFAMMCFGVVLLFAVGTWLTQVISARAWSVQTFAYVLALDSLAMMGMLWLKRRLAYALSLLWVVLGTVVGTLFYAVSVDLYVLAIAVVMFPLCGWLGVRGFQRRDIE